MILTPNNDNGEEGTPRERRYTQTPAQRGHSHSAQALYDAGRADDAYVADAFVRKLDPQIRVLRRWCRARGVA